MGQVFKVFDTRLHRTVAIKVLPPDWTIPAACAAASDKAYEERTAGLVFVNVEPGFDSLRSDPRFQVLLKRLKLSG